MKGILIEKRRRKSIVMDQNGRFIKTRTDKGWSEGDEVSFVSGSVKAARAASIAAAFVLVFALGLFAVYASNAYTVQMDVNPSIEIKVDAFNNVTEIRALNDDAEEIGEYLDGLVGMKFGPAINVAVMLLIDQGYLTEDGTVVLSVEGKNGKVKTVEKLVSEAMADVDIETEDDGSEDPDPDPDTTAEGENDGIKIYVGRITEEMAQKAEELDVPVGRMVLAAKAQEEGAEISFEMAATLSVQELQRIRNLSKTINKATEIVSGTAAEGASNGNGKLKQLEAITDKILREAARIEEDLAELTALIESGEADEAAIERHAVLTLQLEELLTKITDMGIEEDAVTGSKQAENKRRIEEHLAAVKEKVEEMKNKGEVTGEPLAPVDPGDVVPDGTETEGEDEDKPGNSANPNSNAGGNGKGKDKGN